MGSYLFTGSARVGKWIMEKAAQNLSAVTLELGGKSPAILDDHYNLKRQLVRSCGARSSMQVKHA